MIPETPTARILRKMRERDKLLKSIGTHPTMEAIHNTASELQRRIDSVTGSQTQRLLSQIQEPPYQRAIEIAKQLTGASPLLPTATDPRSRTTSADTQVRTVADLGRLIRKARKAMKLNQTDFAAHAGVGRRFLSELESGKPSLEFDKVITCAAAAGIDISARARKA
jgi:y4mF family transcriptional regulator